VKLFALDVTDESAATACCEDSCRYVWLAGRCCQQRGIRQSLVCRRHTHVGFSRANRNEPLRDDHCDKGKPFRISAKGRAVILFNFHRWEGRIGPPGRGPYSAAKWGVEGFSEVLSREASPRALRSPLLNQVAFAPTLREVLQS